MTPIEEALAEWGDMQLITQNNNVLIATNKKLCQHEKYTQSGKLCKKIWYKC